MREKNGLGDPMIRKTSTMLVLLSGLMLQGCNSDHVVPDGNQHPVLLVQSFATHGEYAKSMSVGRAMARSLAQNLSQLDSVTVLPVPELGDSSAVAETTHSIAGTLTQQDGIVVAEVRIRIAGDQEPLLEVSSSTTIGNLPELATSLAKQIADRLDLEYPRLYDYQYDIKGSVAMAASPEGQAAGRAWRESDAVTLARISATLVEIFPEDPAAHYLDAWAYLYSWDRDPTPETLAHLRERLAELNRVDPSSPFDELLRGYIYRSSGKPDWAVRLYSEVLARSDLSVNTRAWALRQRAMTFMQIGNNSNARADAEESVRLGPASASGMFALSKILEVEGHFEDAIASARVGLTFNPDSWRQLQRLGLVLVKAGQYDEALETIGRACESGQNQEVCANLAVTLLKGGKPAEAAQAADNAEELTGTAFGLYNLACYRALAEEPQLALATLARALELGFSDALLKTDTDLDAIRSLPGFDEYVAEVETRLRSKQDISVAVFPWQG
jgi:tetratricopeptide (TPR) repeat protein